MTFHPNVNSVRSLNPLIYFGLRRLITAGTKRGLPSSSADLLKHMDWKREVTMKRIALLGLVVAAVACDESSAQRADNGTAAAMAAALESGVQPQGILARRLASSGEVYGPDRSTFSPDGRYQTFADWSTNGQLAIRNLETGEIRHITSTAESEPVFAVGMVFSSDGTQIAYTWWHMDAYDRLGLRTIATEGGEARTLLDPATRGAHSVTPLDWSPDDETVLAGVSTWESATGTGFSKTSFELVTVSTSDGSVRTLKDDVDFRVPYGRAFFSPDGRYIAYSALFASSDAMSDVTVLALESGHEEQVLSGPSDDQVLGWSEDGRRLYVMSDRAGSPSLWAVPMADGARAGDPQLIRREVHGFKSGHVASGKLFYHIVTEYPKLYTMELDLETGRVLSEPVAEEGGRTVWIAHPVWSPDGQFLAYARGEDPQTIVVRAAMGNHLREFSLPAGFLSVYRMRWTPDSRSLVIAAQGTAHQGSSNVLRLTLATGGFEVGPTNPAESWPLSADGRRVYRSANGVVREWDLTTGERKVLYEVPDRENRERCWPGLPSLSPSGDRLTLVGACIGIMSTDGGEPTWIYQLSPDERAARIVDPRVNAWTADGSSVLFARNVPEQNGLKELWIISATGGPPRRLYAFDWLSSVAAHPDNRRIAFMGGRSRFEMWVMEGLEEAARE
ncbi:MAG: PD40 domain-containing protein [Gemmatimonadota bacterium]|nr:MAG: PD40 domain-containing protein [Gemmatimonadota bacterium]